MIEISDGSLTVACSPDGTDTIIHDRHRGARWLLDEATRVYCDTEGQRKSIGSGKTEIVEAGVLEQRFELDGETVCFRWQIIGDGVEVELSCERGGSGLRRIALPGAFVPEDQAYKLAVPIMQGVLFERCGDDAFEEALPMGAHCAISMAMLGYTCERSSLLVTVEDPSDWLAVIGQRDIGPAYAYVDVRSSLGAMRYARRVRLYPAASGVTALCKRYRSRVQERGEWKSWNEKIAERPAVEGLFGSLMAFIGYNHTDLDYAAQCRKLKDFGFDRVFIYPARFNTYTQDFRMGGDPPIWLDDSQIEQIRKIGYDVSPWTWVVESIDDGTGQRRETFTRSAAGQYIPNWRIDNYQWYICCTPTQIDFVRRSYEDDMKAMTWAHYDVSATAHAAHQGECYALDHPGHFGKPLDRRGDTAFLKDLLGVAANGNRVISSEGFVDTFASSYDIGSTKLLPAWGNDACWTVPMTMLVYHDSVIHDAWELHNYNEHDFGPMHHRYGDAANGCPEIKAAMDALYGSPPNVFPFGRTYKWLDFPTRKSGRIDVAFEDKAVEYALACALPVAQLHRRIGRTELVSHEFLSSDGAVQRTAFSDGTQVIANFSDDYRDDGLDEPIEPKSWKVIR